MNITMNICDYSPH